MVYKKRYIIPAISLIIIVGFSLFFFGEFNFQRDFDSRKRAVHLSIDDAECLSDLIVNQNKYTSIFDNPFLHYLKQLHEKYGIKVTLYTFSQFPNPHIPNSLIKISELPNKFFAELVSNSDWLRVGFHWKSMEFNKNIRVEDFDKAFTEVHNAFNRSSDSTVWANALRLHYFFASDSLMSCLKDVTTLLCADTKGRASYDLTPPEVQYIAKNNRLWKKQRLYLRTDIRLEDHIIDIKQELKNNLEEDTLVIFTHEWALSPQTPRGIIGPLIKNHQLRINALNKYNLERMIRWLNKNKYEYILI